LSGNFEKGESFPSLMKIFVGYDSREDIAFKTCKQSILDASKYPNSVEVIPLKIDDLRKSGIYEREEDKLGSTEFTFTRFLVPHLMNYKGWAVFCDCDFIFREDIRALFQMADPRYAVMCVKHDYKPKAGTKMDGKEQHHYPRKNWSSMVLWNCGHESNKIITKDLINDKEKTGAYFHRFSWLKDEEIGEISHIWNWLVGWYKEPDDGTPCAIHYTEGGPWFKNYARCEYSGDWYIARDSYQKQKGDNEKHKLTPKTWNLNEEKEDILKSVLNYMVDPQAKYYTDNTWNNITERVQKLMGKVVAIDTSEANFAAKGLVYDPILENFVMGSNGTIDEYSAHRDDDAPLVMRGVGGGSRKAIVRCWDSGRTFYTIDTGYFGNFKNKWLHRVTKNNLQYTGPIIERPMDRAKKHGYRYRKFVPGRKILLCPPSDKVMNLFKQPTPEQWVENVKAELKKYTDRPIEVRLKPNRTERVSTNTIQAALNDDVHCLITYNSIAAVEALMEGKPAIVLGSNAASAIAETKLHRIENLELPGREEVEAFFAHLAYCQFDVNELRSGFAWRTVNETASGKLPQWNSKNK
tara:strand:- start:621 stop:2357 length:1737 start_codon:yes stop_codon:yes gene_type:complete